MELYEIVDNGIFLSVLREKWDKIGFTPLYLFKLLERGWTYQEICFVLGHTIGKDFTEIKVSNWMERLQNNGVIIEDEEPFIQLLDRLMFCYLQEHGNEMKGVLGC